MSAPLVFGVKDGRLVSIETEGLSPGFGCGCVCPDCGQRLIAKNNDHDERVRVLHFAHEAGEVCPFLGERKHWNEARETALHRAGKRLLGQRKALMIPEYGLFPGASAPDFRALFRPKLIEFDTVTEEERVTDLAAKGSIRPDVIGRIKGMPDIYIEFKVTHAVGQAKAAAVEGDGRRMIEIDLNAVQGENVDDAQILKFLTESTAHRKWVSHGPGSQKCAEIETASAILRNNETCPAGIGTAGGVLCRQCPCRLSPIGHAAGHFRCTGDSLVTNNDTLRQYSKLRVSGWVGNAEQLPYPTPPYIVYHREALAQADRWRRLAGVLSRLSASVGSKGHSRAGLASLLDRMERAWGAARSRRAAQVEEARERASFNGEMIVFAIKDRQLYPLLRRLSEKIGPWSKPKDLILAHESLQQTTDRLERVGWSLTCDECGLPVMNSSVSGYLCCSGEAKHPLFGKGALMDRLEGNF